MNQGRIWCVVSPSVGLPLLLGGVALTSLAVHTAIMTHTTWMGNYWSGSARTRVSETTAPVPALAAAPAAAPFSVTVTPVATADAKAPASFLISVTPNQVAPDKPAASAPIRAASAE